MSESYAGAIKLLEQGKTDEAALKYRGFFVFTVKQLFSEAADTYPLKFEKASCWASWTRDLYRLSRRAEDAFKDGRIDEAKSLLPQLRRHFYDLHRQCGTMKSNDALFAVVETMAMDDAAVQMIAGAVDEYVKAEPSRKAKADGDAYAEAREKWLAEIRPTLENARLTPEQRAQLRQATMPFYTAYGLEFQ